MVKKINNSFAEDNSIIIRGARQHNLKNIDLSLPRNKFIVFTGVSGSGKSSLAFDTIFAEGQRRYYRGIFSVLCSCSFEKSRSVIICFARPSPDEFY